MHENVDTAGWTAASLVQASLDHHSSDESLLLQLSQLEQVAEFEACVFGGLAAKCHTQWWRLPGVHHRRTASGDLFAHHRGDCCLQELALIADAAHHW